MRIVGAITGNTFMFPAIGGFVGYATALWLSLSGDTILRPESSAKQPSRITRHTEMSTRTRDLTQLPAEETLFLLAALTPPLFSAS